MIALILSAALGQWSPQPPGMLQFDPGAQCQRTGGRCLKNRTSNRPNLFVSLADAPQAGDLSGAWWAMYGDGTMRSGSAVTLVPTGSPTNTVENGWPVRTYTSAQNDQEPANVAFPASDFSVCYQRRQATTAGGDIMAFGTSSGVPGTFSAVPFELGGTMFAFVSDGATFVPTINGGTLTANVWAVWCFTFQRVGSGTSVGTLYKDGAQVAQSTAMRLPQALASVWSTNGAAAAASAPATTSATRGVFVTYKLLSAADVARITAATAP